MALGGIHIIFFLFLYENVCCGYSLEVPCRGTSNEYPQLMFSWRNKKKKYQYFSVEQLPCLELAKFLGNKKKRKKKKERKTTYGLVPHF